MATEIRMLLPSSNPFFNRGPHFPVVIAVILFPSAHVRHDLSINLGPKIVCDRVLVLHVIAAQNALFFQFGESADDLLKGAIDGSPCFIYCGFILVRFHVPKLLDMIYRLYSFKIIEPTLITCLETSLSGL